MINKIYISLALLMFSGLVNAYTVYTDKGEWEGALLNRGNISTEDFEDIEMDEGLASYRVYDLDTGGGMKTYTEFQDFSLIPSTIDKPTFSGTQVFEELANSVATTVWNFSQPIIAFGGNWDLAGPARPGTGLAIEIKINDASTRIGIIPSSYEGGFWGFVAGEGESAFSTAEVLRPGTTGSELYHLDDMVFAPVPLPAAIWLLVSGFIGLFGYKKRFSH